jgi:hypothetical protein
MFLRGGGYGKLKYGAPHIFSSEEFGWHMPGISEGASVTSVPGLHKQIPVNVVVLFAVILLTALFSLFLSICI